MCSLITVMINLDVGFLPSKKQDELVIYNFASIKFPSPLKKLNSSERIV